MGKRLVVCCDGTWNTPDQSAPTNVTKFAMGVDVGGHGDDEQRMLYVRGVGTRRWDRLRGGAFGVGLSRNILEGYRFLAEQYEPGDEIFLVGFSRGAFTARSLAGLIRTCGVLRREEARRTLDAYRLYRLRGGRSHPTGTEAVLFRRSFAHETRIRFIGVWDTVGALGIPLGGLRWLNPLNHRWQFHDTVLSSYVDHAYHAVSVDERRGPFRPTMWAQSSTHTRQVLEQVWFAGVHSDVGGGYPVSDLAEVPLLWMIGKARAVGLRFEAGHFSMAAADAEAPDDTRRLGQWVHPDPHGPAHVSRRGIYRLMRQHVRRPGAEPSPGVPADPRTGTAPPAPHQWVAASVAERAGRDPSYDPPGLREWLAGDGNRPVPVP